MYVQSLSFTCNYSFLADVAACIDRMPVPIGNFISRNVYGLLKTQHEIQDSGCCRFVDVSNGVEESKGHSWKVYYRFHFNNFEGDLQHDPSIESTGDRCSNSHC